MSETSTLRAGALIIALIICDAGLVAVYALDIALRQPSWTVHLLFDLDGEATIPAWFSSAQLLVAAWLFALAAGKTDYPEIPGLFLALVAVGFCFLSMDEIVGIHEGITRSFRDIDALPRFRGGHGIWIPFYLGAGALFAMLTAPYWIRLWRVERRGTLLFGVGVALFLAGAVGVEASSYEELRGLVNRSGYLWSVAIEEFLELAGASCICAAALKMNQTLLSPRSASARPKRFGN